MMSSIYGKFLSQSIQILQTTYFFFHFYRIQSFLSVLSFTASLTPSFYNLIITMNKYAENEKKL